MHARPGKAPKHTARGQRRHARAGLGMPLRVLSVGIDKDIRVDSDQPPRPSYAASLMRCQSAPRNSGRKPRPPTLASCSWNGMGFSSALRTSCNPLSTRDRSVVPCLAAWAFALSTKSSASSMVVFTMGSRIPLYGQPPYSVWKPPTNATHVPCRRTSTDLHVWASGLVAKPVLGVVRVPYRPKSMMANIVFLPHSQYVVSLNVLYAKPLLPAFVYASTADIIAGT